MSFGRIALVGLAWMLLVTGCSSGRARVVDVTEVDGSTDHRIFRIGPLTRLMMEPVLWRLEDERVIDFDRPVADYFRTTALPPEFDRLTLRDLHEDRTGLPRNFFDPLNLEGLFRLMAYDLWGLPERYVGFGSREDFVRHLWSVQTRAQLKRAVPQVSDAGYALLMMAICERLRQTPDELIRRYLVEPYGLKDTCFVPREAMRERLLCACAGERPWLRPAGTELSEVCDNEVTRFLVGMRSSPHDILRVAYVMLPHLDRFKGLLSEHALFNGRKVYVHSGMTWGGCAFLGFDPVDKRAVLRVRNASGSSVREDEFLEILQRLADVRLLSDAP